MLLIEWDGMVWVGSCNLYEFLGVVHLFVCGLVNYLILVGFLMQKFDSLYEVEIRVYEIMCFRILQRLLTLNSGFYCKVLMFVFAVMLVGDCQSFSVIKLVYPLSIY